MLKLKLAQEKEIITAVPYHLPWLTLFNEDPT
jgi:hypothetical protein